MEIKRNTLNNKHHFLTKIFSFIETANITIFVTWKRFFFSSKCCYIKLLKKFKKTRTLRSRDAASSGRLLERCRPASPTLSVWKWAAQRWTLSRPILWWGRWCPLGWGSRGTFHQPPGIDGAQMTHLSPPQNHHTLLHLLHKIDLSMEAVTQVGPSCYGEQVQ